MKSKLVFILLGIFFLFSSVLFLYSGNIELIIFLSGILIVILGIILLVKEFAWRRNSEIVPAKVARYYDYEQARPGSSRAGITMYTMEAEYTTAAGKYIKAREQSGSSSRKFPEGTDIRVRYSRENPELFIIEGDSSRIYAMLAVIGMGAAIIFIFAALLFNGGQN
jgi:hypothetical protein